MTRNARSLRKAATSEERKLWAILRDSRPRFTRQLPVGPYILDFACRSVKLAVELDGSQHADRMTYDAARTAFLERIGWQVLRFWNNDVRDNIDGVVETIIAAVALRVEPTHPQPLPSREGS